MRGKGRSPKRRPREGRPGVQRPASTVVRVRTNPTAVMGLIGSIRPPSLLQGTVMEVSLADPHAMQDAGELAGESDLRTLRTATLGQAHPPGLQRRPSRHAR